MQEFTPPKDPVLHAIWVIKNWTKTPKGNLQSYEDIVRKVHQLALEVFEHESKSRLKRATLHSS